MALGANALITFAYMQVLADVADDEEARTEVLIDAASVAANQYTARLLAARDITETLDGNGKKSLLLPEYPVNSIASLFIDTERAFGAATEITDFLTYDEGEIYYAGVFPNVRQSVRVTWNAGYASDAVPDDIQIAVGEMVEWYLQRFKGAGIGVAAIQNPDGIATQFERDIPLSARQRLNRYKKVR